MTKPNLVPLLALLMMTACSVLRIGSTPDPLAGWGGTWSGAYQGTAGNSGSLVLEFHADTAGAPIGVAHFDADGAMNQARLLDLRLSPDSLRARLAFDGLSVRLSGSRQDEAAEGSYLLRYSGSDAVIDSGNWQVARNPLTQE
ncbi:MAG: hypothetical protein GWN99_09550 [Gemmatimonadetes bacterium]|uniref:Lipoprotein n=1 Tax=Candidatus Kutchimonas denitrificans TaxID=3056748 RepID=A0AAE4Z9R3_9BACT|nr:hypothetical protein [Gemmatimonadota bacterium]NIR74111.1 hypothetical protein [Candidatus Kutchimonas denitrificans]NIS01293.1 hypothetical protein [Gemmatimonadota bacterium]NIT67024.1 hypothetical protein [Gemmatimonadota bacterium]NIU51684.1 hypothetical protein [Gemmatimonadota bacterium]